MKQVLIVFAFIFSVSINGFSQRGYVRKAIEKNQEEKHQDEKNKGEKAVDERLDAWDASDKKMRDKIEPFPTMSYTMDMEYPKKPKHNGSIDYSYKGYQCATNMHMDNDRNQETRTIMNFKEGKSIMLMTDKKGKKTGMEMELKMIDWGARAAVNKENEMLKNGDAELKATDEYKTIEGYKCRKYEYRNQKYISDIWITNDVKFDYNHYNRALASVYSTQPYAQMEYYKSGMKGIAIQIHTISDDPRIGESILTMKNIKTGSINESAFSTEGYTIEKMPSVRDMWNSFKKED